MSKPDPVIDEVRQIRHEISERVGHDPVRLVEYYMKLQEQYRERLLPRRPATRAAGKPAA